MNHQTRGILVLFLVTSIAMATLLSFGLRAMSISSQAQVSPVQCQYSQMIISAKVAPVEP